jgi:hypothetical protein
MRGGTACLSPIAPNAHTPQHEHPIPIPQGLDEVGHGRRTQFHHRCAHRLMRQRPDQHAPSPLRHHLSHRLRQREGSLTHLLQSRLRYPLPGVRPHAQSRHRLSIPYRTQRPTRRSTNIAIPSPKAWMRGGTACPSPIAPNAQRDRLSHPTPDTPQHEHPHPIPQGLDEGGHRLSIPYLTQRLTRRSTNIPIPSPKAWMRGGTACLSPISPNAHTPQHEHPYPHPPRLG